ncbi:MAG: hypothetical protein ACM3ZT_01875 [Bacillota bacterium]
MRYSLTASALLLFLAACAHSPATGIGAPMHAENGVQVGWHLDATPEGDAVITVQSNGSADFGDLVKVAENQADAHCKEGYRVLSLSGSDEPQVDSLNPRFVLDNVVRMKVRCYEKESSSSN